MRGLNDRPARDGAAEEVSRLSRNYVAALAPRFADGFLDVGSEKSSRGCPFLIFSPGIGTGYSPVRQPRQMSSRECFSAVMSPFMERYPSESALMKSAISGTVFSFAMNWSRVFMSIPR